MVNRGGGNKLRIFRSIDNNTAMPPDTDCPYPIRILAFLR